MMVKKIAVVFVCISIVISAQFPPISTTTAPASQPPAESESKKASQEKPKETVVKLTSADIDSMESLIDEQKNLFLKVTRPKNNSLWRFLEGVKYDKENWIAAELWRLEKEDEENYPLMRLYIRVFDNQLLEHLYKREKFKHWKEFWKKMFFDYEINTDSPDSFFAPEKVKIEKNLVDANYKINSKKVGVVEYQVVGTPREAPNVSYRVRAIIFKDKQFTIIFRVLAQVVGKELSKTLEDELLEILNKVSLVEIKKKK